MILRRGKIEVELRYLGQVICLPKLVFLRRSLALEHLLEDSEIVWYVESIPRVLHRKQKMDFLGGQAKKRTTQEGGCRREGPSVEGGVGKQHWFVACLSLHSRDSTLHVS